MVLQNSSLRGEEECAAAAMQQRAHADPCASTDAALIKCSRYILELRVGVSVRCVSV